jgi:hypothetical protein
MDAQGAIRLVESKCIMIGHGECIDVVEYLGEFCEEIYSALLLKHKEIT